MLCTPRSRSARTTSSRSWPARDLHDEHEPAAAVAAGVRARQLEPLDAGERLAVARGDPRAGGEHAVEALELGEADRAGEVGQAVVEAEAVVVEPAHVRRAALVALAVDPLLDRRVARCVTIPPSPVVSCLLA